MIQEDELLYVCAGCSVVNCKALQLHDGEQHDDMYCYGYDPVVLDSMVGEAFEKKRVTIKFRRYNGFEEAGPISEKYFRSITETD